MVKNLSQNQRRILQFGVILVLIVFLGLYFFKSAENGKSGSVELKGNQLQVFDDVYVFNGYPDKIFVHYPYFLLVQADKPRTLVYDLEKNTKVEEAGEVLLDYYDGNKVFNRKVSYYNEKSLDKYCDAAFIKSPTEVLCITRTSPDSFNNILISINPEEPNLWVQEYDSKRLLTGISYFEDGLYISEIDPKNMQDYITIGGESLQVDNSVNTIFPAGGSVFYVSFPDDLKTKESLYFKIDNKKLTPIEGIVGFK